MNISMLVEPCQTQLRSRQVSNKFLDFSKEFPYILLASWGAGEAHAAGPGRGGRARCLSHRKDFRSVRWYAIALRLT